MLRIAVWVSNTNHWFCFISRFTFSMLWSLPYGFVYTLSPPRWQLVRKRYLGMQVISFVPLHGLSFQRFADFEFTSRFCLHALKPKWTCVNFFSCVVTEIWWRRKRKVSEDIILKQQNKTKQNKTRWASHIEIPIPWPKVEIQRQLSPLYRKWHQLCWFVVNCF